MGLLFKAGVEGDLYPVMQKALTRIESTIGRMYGEDTIVTSKREGNHSAGSLHYIGRAVDIRFPQKTRTSGDRLDLCERLREVLGPGYDVVLESTHIHIELDNVTR